MTLKEIYTQVALKEGINKKDVELIYNNYWRFIKEFISSIPLKEEYTEEEYSKLKTSVNIPSIGKLHCTYKRYLSLKRKFNHKREEYEN